MEPFSGRVRAAAAVSPARDLGGSSCLSCLQAAEELWWGYRLRATAHWAQAVVAGPTHGPWAHSCSVWWRGGRGRGVPFRVNGELDAWGTATWRICLSGTQSGGPSSCGNYKHTLGHWLQWVRTFPIVWRGGPSTSTTALHFVLQREHVVKFDGENYTSKFPLFSFVNWTKNVRVNYAKFDHNNSL